MSTPDTAALVCSICPWIGEEGRPPTPALTIINGHAVCKEHMRAAHLAQDHRQAVVLTVGAAPMSHRHLRTLAHTCAPMGS